MKHKLNVSFNSELTRPAEVIDALKPFKVVKTSQKGKYTWKCVIKSNKDTDTIVEALSKKAIVRDVEVPDNQPLKVKEE